MAKKILTTQDRLALDSWNELVASVREHSDINPTDTETEIRQRRERLEKNDEEWFKYYFAMYCTCESAAFHRKATGRLMRNNRWYEVRAWSRELAKIRTLHDGDIQTGTDKKDTQRAADLQLG